MKIMTKIHNFIFLISTGLIILTHFFNKTFAAVTLCYIYMYQCPLQHWAVLHYLETVYKFFICVRFQSAWLFYLICHGQLKTSVLFEYLNGYLNRWIWTKHKQKKQDSIYYLYGYKNRYEYKKINNNIH